MVRSSSPRGGPGWTVKDRVPSVATVTAGRTGSSAKRRSTRAPMRSKGATRPSVIARASSSTKRSRVGQRKRSR